MIVRNCSEHVLGPRGQSLKLTLEIESDCDATHTFGRTLVIPLSACFFHKFGFITLFPFYSEVIQTTPRAFKYLLFFFLHNLSCLN